MKNSLILILKILFVVVLVRWLGEKFYDSWVKVGDGISASKQPITINWAYGIVAAGGFCASMLTSAMVWRWLAAKMGDRSPAVPVLGAYTFSQMGKYIPGKVWLLFMRIERAGRFGMSARVCTLATILENALYMISGGLVGMAAIVHLADHIDARFRPFIWPVTVVAIAALLVVCYPPVFYGMVNRIMRRLKQTIVPPQEQLGVGTLAFAAIGFVPCWIFGGIALWASTQAVHPIALADCWWFPGAFALSVIIGMGSFLPGGALVRESLLTIAVMLQLSRTIPQQDAWVIAGIVAVLQRLFQVIAEAVLGISGAMITGVRATTPPSAAAESQ